MAFGPGDAPEGDQQHDRGTRRGAGRGGASEGGPRGRATAVEGLAAAIARIESGGRPAAPTTAGAVTRRRAPTPDDLPGPAGDDPGDPEAVAKSICLRQLTGQARSRSELDAALRRREIPPDVAQRVLDRFTEVGLIDDAAYAQAFVASKHRDRGLGRAALRTELRRKGIDGPAADRALEPVDTDAERRRAADLVAKRLDSAVFAGLPAARRRLLGLLARRGYSASLSAQVVNEALRGYVEPADVPSDDDSATWTDTAP